MAGWASLACGNYCPKRLDYAIPWHKKLWWRIQIFIPLFFYSFRQCNSFKFCVVLIKKVRKGSNLWYHLHVTFFSPKYSRPTPTSLFWSFTMVINGKLECNRLSPPLTNIVCFGPLRIANSLTVSKTRLLGRDFHTLIRNVSFSSSNRCGISQSTSFEGSMS